MREITAPNGRLVYGVGINDSGEFLARINGKATRQHWLWVAMLKRCYSQRYQDKNPSYRGCTVDGRFLHFQGFAEWAMGQVGFNRHGWQIDKDIIHRGNRVYGPETCAFVPTELNQLFTKADRIRGELPIGVSKSVKGMPFEAGGTQEGKHVWLGRHSTPELAFLAYKTFKESLIKKLAQKHRDAVDRRVFEALMKYEVNITD